GPPSASIQHTGASSRKRSRVTALGMVAQSGRPVAGLASSACLASSIIRPSPPLAVPTRSVPAHVSAPTPPGSAPTQTNRRDRCGDEEGDAQPQSLHDPAGVLGLLA